MFNKADTTISFASKANFVSYLVFITISNRGSFKFVLIQAISFFFFFSLSYIL